MDADNRLYEERAPLLESHVTPFMSHITPSMSQSHGISHMSYVTPSVSHVIPSMSPLNLICHILCRMSQKMVTLHITFSSKALSRNPSSNSDTLQSPIYSLHENQFKCQKATSVKISFRKDESKLNNILNI